jgi:hypothetical protein
MRLQILLQLGDPVSLRTEYKRERGMENGERKE